MNLARLQREKGRLAKPAHGLEGVFREDPLGRRALFCESVGIESRAGSLPDTQALSRRWQGSPYLFYRGRAAGLKNGCYCARKPAGSTLDGWNLYGADHSGLGAMGFGPCESEPRPCSLREHALPGLNGSIRKPPPVSFPRGAGTRRSKACRKRMEVLSPQRQGERGPPPRLLSTPSPASDLLRSGGRRSYRELALIPAIIRSVLVP